jgi:hypothetical protein
LLVHIAQLENNTCVLEEFNSEAGAAVSFRLGEGWVEVWLCSLAITENWTIEERLTSQSCNTFVALRVEPGSGEPMKTRRRQPS